MAARPVSDAGRLRERPAVRPVRGRGEVLRDTVEPFLSVQLLRWHRARRPLGGLPSRFDSWYSVTDRSRWGEDSARESRLRWRRLDDVFHMWHSTELFSVPSAARRGLYPRLPADWSSLEAPEYLCVPTPSALAYVAAHWLPRGRAESAKTEHTRGLVRAIVLSEWAVLALL